MTTTISWTSPEGVERSLRFDAVTSEHFDAGAPVTAFVVDSGAPISDHKRSEPVKLTIEGRVTNRPHGAPPPGGRGAYSGTLREVKRDGLVLQEFSAPFDRVRDVEESLDFLRTTATECTVETTHRTLGRAQLVKVASVRDPGDGSSKAFTVEFEQIRVADTVAVDIPTPIEPRGRRTTDTGTQGTEEIAEEDESMLHRGARAVAGLLRGDG